MGCTQGKLTQSQILLKETKRIMKQNRKDNQEYLKSLSTRSAVSKKQRQSAKTVDTENLKLDFFVNASSTETTKEKYEFLVQEVSKEYPRASFEPNMVRNVIVEVFDVYLEGKKVYCQEVHGDIRENISIITSNINKVVNNR